ncbi:MAG: hypothetical protein MJ247_00100 [Alphaproteobacteria bacterium]|nr:hypothetical protein [Alphaproteobacteria bacterium]
MIFNGSFSKIQTPYYLINMDELVLLLNRAKENAKKLNINLLLAAKGFPLGTVYPNIAHCIDGISASGLFEAKIGKKANKEVHIHSVVYKENDFEEILSNCDHIVFNSNEQAKKFVVENASNSFGIRLNPKLSQVSKGMFDPCVRYSRFGEAFDTFKLNKNISGIHIHALNQSGTQAFINLIKHIEKNLSQYFNDISWINLGGGQLFSDPNFVNEELQECMSILTDKYHLKVYVEPCEYITTYAGYAVATVKDIVHNEKDIAILDMSAVIHMNDVVEKPYIPSIAYPKLKNNGYEYILAGNSCLSEDVFGTFLFENKLCVGDKIVFSNTGAYSFAMQNYFNGINYPNIVLYDNQNGYKLIKSFSFDDYNRVFG